MSKPKNAQMKFMIQCAMLVIDRHSQYWLGLHTPLCDIKENKSRISAKFDAHLCN